MHANGLCYTMSIGLTIIFIKEALSKTVSESSSNLEVLNATLYWESSESPAGAHNVDGASNTVRSGSHGVLEER